MSFGVTIFFAKRGTNPQKMASRGQLSQLLTVRILNGRLAKCENNTALLHLSLLFAEKANMNLTYTDAHRTPLSLLGFISGVTADLPEQERRFTGLTTLRPWFSDTQLR